MFRPTGVVRNDRPVRFVLNTAVLLLGLLLWGCAFDVARVQQMPVTFAPAAAGASFVLREAAVVRIGTGYPVNLKAHTTWARIGTTEFGDVYTSRDQVLTVEASNIHEAALVMRETQIVGFYLLIEKKYCPATAPVTLAITPQ